MNKKLIDLYETQWPSLSKELNSIVENDSLNQKPTNPLLLSVNEKKYIESDIKVMILGQETNDWGDDFHGDLKNIIGIYDDFYHSGYANNGYGGHFWNGINRFSSLLEDNFKGKNISYIWNNVVKIGASGRNKNHPKGYIYEVELNLFKVLEKELEILNPDIILFVSGPRYDNNITKQLEGVRFAKLSDDYSQRQLAKLEYKNHKNIFRTYHPNYLWRNNINRYFKTIIGSIEL